MPTLEQIRLGMAESGIGDEFATRANAIAGKFRDDQQLNTLPLSRYITANPKRQVAAYPPELLEWVYFLNSTTRVEKIEIEKALGSLIRWSDFKTVGDVRRASVEGLVGSDIRGMGPIRAGLLKLIFEPIREGE